MRRVLLVELDDLCDRGLCHLGRAADLHRISLLLGPLIVCPRVRVVLAPARRRGGGVADHEPVRERLRELEALWSTLRGEIEHRNRLFVLTQKVAPIAIALVFLSAL